MKCRLKTIFLINAVFLSLTLGAPLSLCQEVAPLLPEGADLGFADKMKMKISIDYKNAEIVNILRSLSWTHKLNIVTSPDIKGKVTLSLKDVTVEEALEAIISITGLTSSVRDNIIYVAPGAGDIAELESKVIFLKYMKSADVQNMVKKALSPKGDIKIDEIANSLIVVDYPTNIKKVGDLIKKIDIAPKQVLIEAKIVDITSTDLNAIGVSWNFDYSPTTEHLKRWVRVPKDLNVSMSLAEQSSDLTGGQFVLNALDLKWLTVTATLDALVRDGKANLLASPSIAVLNGQEARIIIGERFPYKERTQTATGTTETTKFVDIGTTLRVTPQINDDGYITMRIHPEVSSLVESLDAGPRITTREADTTVRVKEGETLIIGGLIKQEDEKSIDRVPILGDIPIIGYLFTRQETDNEQKELAVFITPKILLSRDEKRFMSEEEISRQEAYVDLTSTGELSVVEELFTKARMLDFGRGLQSRRKDEKVQKTQAANIYEHIFQEFPDNLRAPEALYHAGMIHYSYFKDRKKAKALFGNLIKYYPDNKYSRKALWKYKRIERMEKGKRKKESEAPQESSNGSDWRLRVEQLKRKLKSE